MDCERYHKEWLKSFHIGVLRVDLRGWWCVNLIHFGIRLYHNKTWKEEICCEYPMHCILVTMAYIQYMSIGCTKIV